MGKNSKKDRMMRKTHNVKVAYKKAQIRFLKSPKSRVEYSWAKESFRNEIKLGLGMVAVSGFGAILYMLACEVMK